MFLSVIASTGEVVIVGVVLGADPSRCTYTLIGCALSPRIGAPSIRAMIRPLSKGEPDAPIWSVHELGSLAPWRTQAEGWIWRGDRKSTRLNSSHSQISYAVFCL